MNLVKLSELIAFARASHLLLEWVALMDPSLSMFPSQQPWTLQLSTSHRIPMVEVPL